MQRYQSAKLSMCLLLFWATISVAQKPVSSDSNQTHQFGSAVLQVVEAIEIPATASGPLRSIVVEPGEMVKTGQLLAAVVDDEIEVRLREAKIELDIITAQTQSNLDIEFALKSKAVAVADLRRARESNQRYAGVVSDREMDRLKLLVEQSAAELEKIKFEKTIQKMQQSLKSAAVERARIDVTRHEIKSKIDGQVIEVLERAGQWVNVSDPVVRIVRLDVLRIEHYLPAAFATNDLLGVAARFSPSHSPFPGSSAASEQETYAGKVVFVSPEINALNSTVKVWLEFPNKNSELRPGMKGTVIIEKDAKATQATVGKTVR